MYSGNLGLYYEFETILHAADMLRDEPFRLVLIGSGGRRTWIEGEIKRRRLTNTHLLPYQPFEHLRDSLTACDASLVTIAEGIEGISFPSKLYTSLAVGRPVLALAEEESDLRTVVEESDIGFWFRHGDAEGLVQCIRAWMSDPETVCRMGHNARRLFEENYTLEAAGAQYARVLRQAAVGTPSPGDAVEAGATP
jgi:glycosyltransferase involved in cell wall biosynthesis